MNCNRRRAFSVMMLAPLASLTSCDSEEGGASDWGESTEESEEMSELDKAIDEILRIMREHKKIAAGWVEILEVCAGAYPKMGWKELPDLSFGRDIEEARDWLVEQLDDFKGGSGVYLGLDTLNMGAGDGMNIQFGISARCDPAENKLDWLEDDHLDDLRLGDDHLIRGLYELHRVYSGATWKPAFGFCDYAFFLGYSGLILTHAFEILATPRTLLPGWGFHDGDIYLLGRKANGRFERICELPE